MKRLMFLLTLFVCVILPITLVSGQNAETFVMSTSGDVSTFNPVILSNGPSSYGQQFISPLPFDVDRFTGLPLAGLTTWEVSDDSTVYTFKIRDDAVWSDGVPITSADAKFTYDALVSDLVQSTMAGSRSSFKEVNIIDDKTYEIVLNEPDCAIWSDLGQVHWLPAHKFAPDFSDVMTNPYNSAPDISGGPYILDEVVPGEYQRYRANPTFWGGEPAIPFVVIRIMSDPAVVNQALVAGEIDYAFLSPDQFEQLPSLDNLNYASVSTYNVYGIHLNYEDPNDLHPAFDKDGNPVEQSKNPFFSDIRVRQAIAMGYDKAAVLEAMGGPEAGTLISSLIVPALKWAYNPDVKPWPYDPQRAAELLDEAGWTMNEDTGVRECHGCLYAEEGTPLAFELATSPASNAFETLALVAQDQLGQLGMDITLNQMEIGALLSDLLVPHKFDAMVMSWGAFNPPDPSGLDLMLRMQDDIPGAAYNIQSYHNPEMDQLMQEARTVPGCAPEQRAKLYYQIQQIQHDDVAIDFAFTTNVYHVMNKRVQGFNPGPWWSIHKGIRDLSLGS